MSHGEFDYRLTESNRLYCRLEERDKLRRSVWKNAHWGNSFKKKNDKIWPSSLIKWNLELLLIHVLT